MLNILTADLGNSALKLLLWRCEPDGSAAQAVLRMSLDRGANLVRCLADLGELDGAALSSVVNVEQGEKVRAALQGALRGRGRLALDPDVVNRCSQPESTGRDRLFALRGAFELGFERALVLDAGSALTVDAYLREGGRPVLLGGAIAPGPALLANALASGTARLPRVVPRPGVPALGQDTLGAVLAGIAIGFRGAARELAEGVAHEAGLGAAPVLLTGGAAPFLDDPGLFPGRELRLEADLVQRGLLAAALAELAS